MSGSTGVGDPLTRWIASYIDHHRMAYWNFRLPRWSTELRLCLDEAIGPPEDESLEDYELAHWKPATKETTRER